MSGAEMRRMRPRSRFGSQLLFCSKRSFSGSRQPPALQVRPPACHYAPRFGPRAGCVSVRRTAAKYRCWGPRRYAVPNKNFGITMIYVIHDQIETMTLSTRIRMMNHGFPQQIRRPRGICDLPANLIQASLAGSGSPMAVEFSGCGETRRLPLSQRSSDKQSAGSRKGCSSAGVFGSKA